MATAFMNTYSQSRCSHRSSGLFFSLAKNHLLRLAVVVLMTMVLLTASAVAELAQVDGVTYIHGCSDLVNDRTPVHGNVCIVEDLICNVTKTIELTEGCDEVIIVAKDAIRTKGLRFEVRQGATLSFGGPAFFFERKQDNTDAIFQVDGFLGFEADDAIYEAPQSATPEDLHGLIGTNPGASVSALLDSAIWYTEDTVIAVSNSKTKNKSRTNDKAGTDRANSNTGTGTSNTGTGITGTDITDTTNTDIGITDTSNTGITDTSNTGTDSARPTPPIVDDLPVSNSNTDIGITDTSNTGTGITDSSDTDTDSARPTLPVVDGLPISTLHSCDELRSERTHVQGMSGALLLDFDILCTETRVLEVTDKLLVVSDKPNLRLKGVHFRVRKKAALTFMVPTLTMEKLEGVSGPLFTIEPQGSVEMNADQWVPPPENGTEASEKEAYTPFIPRTKVYPDASYINRLPIRSLGSCDELPLDRNRLDGAVYVTGPIVCDEKRVIEISQETVIFTRSPDLYLMGVHFLVRENAGLWISMGTMTVEALEASTMDFDGDSEEFFTVEPQGHLGLFANEVGPVSEKGTSEDLFSRLVVKSGGALVIEGRMSCATSIMTIIKDSGDTPMTTINSCDRIPFGLIPVRGILIIEGDIVCAEKRTLVVSELALIFSDMDGVRFERVHFIVEQNATLSFAVASLLVEKLEGDSGEIFTIEPGGFLGGQFDQLRPLPENGTKKDEHSLLHAKEGGEFYFDALVRYTSSSITMVAVSVIEDPAWIRLQRLRRRWIERHFQRHQQQSPFSPDRSAEYTYEQRLGLKPTHLMVGEELRFPSSLTTLDRSHTMTMGTDGSLVLAKADRYVVLFDEMIEAVETRASVEETTMATLAGLSPDYDGGDPGLELKILALADSGQATDDKVLHMMARSERLRVWQKETATDMEVDLEKCARGFDELLRAKKRERDLQMEKEEEEEKEAEKTTMPQQQADPTTAGHSSDPKQEHAGQDASSTSTSTSTSGRGKTKAKTKAVPATVTRYWGTRRGGIGETTWL
ncbi:hypothetical protein Esi_0098_0054 [Ectocarpus siliculosus]|uniref:Uncharacterized protein n=1 Tax=Ectocarpus siliculosus TaxID=2880 RepID=D7G9G6_ECTSI|nr:hypothetical protein Esi_0098_0054 [Ectocarpus siliculosus]|eukprot:CBJ28306.1 hypothetical protein Esi_0098_0054 [Ectocarpus siliculosus]